MSDDDIVTDYALTTVGLQPVYGLFAARFKAQQVFRDNWQGAINHSTARCVPAAPPVSSVPRTSD